MILDFTTARVPTLRGQLGRAVKSVRTWGGDPDRRTIGDVATYVPSPTAAARQREGRRTLAVEVGNVRSLSSAWDEMITVVELNPHVEHAVYGMVSWFGPDFAVSVDYLLNEARLLLATLGMRRHKYAIEVYETGRTRATRIIALRLDHRTGWAVESLWYDLAQGQIGSPCLDTDGPRAAGIAPSSKEVGA
jgi:hypothetical protein